MGADEIKFNVGWWFSTATANDASDSNNDLTGSGSPSVSTLTTSY